MEGEMVAIIIIYYSPDYITVVHGVPATVWCNMLH